MPTHSRAPRCPPSGMSAAVLIARRGLIVMITHSPWISHAQKKRSLVFLISTNLLSCFTLRMRRKRKSPNRPVHTNTIRVAMICYSCMEGLVRAVMMVIEMKVRLPVRSQYFSVLLSKAGTKDATCTSSEKGARSHGKGTPHRSRERPPKAYAKRVDKVSTTISDLSFFIKRQ